MSKGTSVKYVYFVVGRDSAVGIATSYALDGSGGVQLFRSSPEGAGAHRAFYKMGTGSLSRE